jgi:hypothetical protein
MTHSNKKRHDGYGSIRLSILLAVAIGLWLPAGSRAQSAAIDENAQRRQRTLESVAKLDDHPLYVMKYFGDYDIHEEIQSSSRVLPDPGWACSLFVALGDKDRPLYGRNFDWFDNPAVVLLTDTSEGYASISMVDVSYLGYEKNDEKFDSVDGREGLLRAPLIPFDGMNEHGLVVGMAAVPESQLPAAEGRPVAGSLRIIRLALDQCRTVEESIELFKQYSIDFEGGPQIHYLIADADGQSALIEYTAGKMHVIRSKTPWQAATNFCMAGNQAKAGSLCHRYGRIEQRLGKLGGALDHESALGLLKEVAQANTRWSVVYDMKGGRADIAMSRDFADLTSLTLADEKPTEQPSSGSK